ncbi:MAG: hypothetical protein KJ955_07365 [Nanoarchaeota archaeon]|nr:hypothetical protein [Nanoarchaeota archaeon]
MRLKYAAAAIAAAFSMNPMVAADNNTPQISFCKEPLPSSTTESPASEPVASIVQLAAENPFNSQPSSNMGCEETQTFTFYGSTFHACKDDVNQQLLNTFTLIGKIKQYEKEVLGLEETLNYLEYRSNRPGMEPTTVYLLSIVPENDTALDAVVVGIATDREYREPLTVATRLNSTVDDLLDEEAYYRAQGYDVYRRATSNFGLGCYLTPELMQRATEAIIAVVLEEDFHSNVRKNWHKYPKPDVEESTANLVSHAGAVEIVSQYIGEDTEIYRSAVKALEDYKRFSLFVVDAYNDYEAILTGGHADEERQRLTDELFERVKKTWPSITNPAALSDRLPYTRLFPLAYAVYEHQDNVRAFVDLMKEMPDSEYSAIGYMEKYCNGCSYSPLTRHVIE